MIDELTAEVEISAWKELATFTLAHLRLKRESNNFLNPRLDPLTLHLLFLTFSLHSLPFGKPPPLCRDICNNVRNHPLTPSASCAEFWWIIILDATSPHCLHNSSFVVPQILVTAATSLVLPCRLEPGPRLFNRKQSLNQLQSGTTEQLYQIRRYLFCREREPYIAVATNRIDGLGKYKTVWTSGSTGHPSVGIYSRLQA